MTTELTIRDNEVVDVETGEVKDLTVFTNDELHDAVEYVTELAVRVAEMKKRLATEAWARRNRNQPVKGLKVESSRKWDPETARNALTALVGRQAIPAESLSYVFDDPKPKLKADGRGLTRLLNSLTSEKKFDEAAILSAAARDSVSARLES